ncbi:Pathogenesis-related protein 1C [Pseudocercospora fuligena]|uniref:Pathogenesis-related protein 1C n=1 Tax=Pseudocercospora fuligena TaxID=685502 RepID=A0A8H6RLU3_9PEZI|nr:Pathogenesis-related protein 1C [Pseudocercospora fuligena]
MSDAQQSLDRHNQARAEKGVQPLQWDDQLASDAEAYAQKLAGMNCLQHSGVVSENLAWASDDCSFDRAVEMWLSEEKDYHGERIGEGNFMAYGHYTQAMWSSTTHIGMGRAKTSDGATFVVGIYNPGGNMTGETPY